MLKSVFACLLLAALPGLASAQATPAAQAANEQVVVPQVDRRDVKPPRFPSNDFEVSLFAGSFATILISVIPRSGISRVMPIAVQAGKGALT